MAKAAGVGAISVQRIWQANGLTPVNPVLLRVFQISATVGRGIQRSATV